MMGIFDGDVDLWGYWRVRLQFRDLLMGGTPKNPKVIEGWLKTKAGISSAEELRRQVLKTLGELGYEPPEEATYEELEEALMEIAGQKGNGFKKDPDLGLYLEGRHVKAAIKETVNILFAGDRWGRTKKGPKNLTAERVFVVENIIPLGREEPDGAQTMIGHVSDKQGPRSTLTDHEYVEGAEITFHIMEMLDTKSKTPSISLDDWKLIWTAMQWEGLHALRSQGYGTFDIVEFTQVDEVPAVGTDAERSIRLLDEEASA